MDVNYAFTVKCNTKGYYPMVSDYIDWIQNAQSKGCKIDVYYFEIDSKDRLHMHGVMRAKKDLFKKSLVFKSFHQRIDEIPSFLDLQKWGDYISKTYINEDEYRQMLVQYEYRHMTHKEIFEMDEDLYATEGH